MLEVKIRSNTCKLLDARCKKTRLETVYHRFLIPGYSYIEWDQDFDLTDKSRILLRQYVFVPDDLVRVVT